MSDGRREIAHLQSQKIDQMDPVERIEYAMFRDKRFAADVRAFVEKQTAALRAALLDADRTWSFDEHQQHTHTWHDKQAWREKHRTVLEEARDDD